MNDNAVIYWHGRLSAKDNTRFPLVEDTQVRVFLLNVKRACITMYKTQREREREDLFEDKHAKNVAHYLDSMTTNKAATLG